MEKHEDMSTASNENYSIYLSLEKAFKPATPSAQKPFAEPVESEGLIILIWTNFKPDRNWYVWL